MISLYCALTTTAQAADVNAYVGKFPAKIIPEQISLINIAEKGEITELLPPSARVSKGSIIAKLNAEDIVEAKEDSEFEIATEKIQIMDQVRELESSRSELLFYSKLSTQERSYAPEKEPQTDKKVALDDINERIKLKRMEYDRVSIKKQKAIKAMEEKRILRMPFDGRLQYHFPIPRDLSQPFEFVPTQQFATACDDSSFYIALNISSAALSQLPAERFTAVIDLPAGKVLRGSFAHRRVEQSSNDSTLIYSFRVEDKDKERAFSMIGTSARAKLYYNCEEPTLILSKASLSTNPLAEDCSDWTELIRKTHPEHHILIETEKDIILIPATKSQL